MNDNKFIYYQSGLFPISFPYPSPIAWNSRARARISLHTEHTRKPSWRKGYRVTAPPSSECVRSSTTHISDKSQTYSSSRSSNVIDLGANRKPMCNFSLVINSNFGSSDVSPIVFEILTHKTRKQLVFPPYSCLTRRSGKSRQNFWTKLIPQKVEGWGYCTVKIAWSWLQPFLTDPPVTDGRTDRQTDGQTDGRVITCSALSIHAVVR